MTNTKIFSIPCTYSSHVDNGSQKIDNLAGASVSAGDPPYHLALEFDLSLFSTVINEWHGAMVTPFSVVDVELEITHKNASGAFSVIYIDTDIQLATAYELHSAITDGDLLRFVELSSDRRKKTKISIPDITTYVTDAIDGGLKVSCAISPSTGAVSDMGGSTLVYGEGEEWRAANSEPTDPPRLWVTYSYDIPDFPRFESYYTTSDPLTAQSSPRNSIGGYASKNAIYSSGYLTSNINTTSTEVSSSATPADGLVQIGPEIAANSDGTLTRGISPAALPSSIDPYPDDVRYILVNQLFENTPLENTPQYRCIAIKNNGVSTNNLKISILQKTDSDVQVDVAIEVPSTDSHSGTHSGSSSSAFIEDNSSFPSGTISGLYDGSAVIVDDNPNRIAIIDSFSFDEGTLTATITFPDGFSINTGETYVICPAPSQIVATDADAPNAIFLGDGASNKVILNQHDESFNTNDVVYLWVKRMFTRNVVSSPDTGAVIAIQHTPNSPSPVASSYVLGVWDFDRRLSDRYIENDFTQTAGTSSYSLISKYNVLSNSTSSSYGLQLGSSNQWSAGSVFVFSSAPNTYKMSFNFWWYSPSALGQLRHSITRETTARLAPVLSKANSSEVDGVETISAGEWILCEAGVSATHNAMRLYICSGGTYPTMVVESDPYLPGLHNVHVSYLGQAGNSMVSVEIDGASSVYAIGPSAIPTTIGQLRINSTGFGQIAHKTQQSGAIISELVLRSSFVDLGDATRIIRYGWDFALSDSTYFDKFAYIGLGYTQPATISTTMIVADGSDMIVARSNGEILRGSRPTWDVEHSFDDERIIPLLRAGNPDGVSIEDSKLTISGTSIRIP